MSKIFRESAVVISISVLTLVWMLSGCSTLNTGNQSTSAANTSASVAPPAAPEIKENVPVYYDFGDVMLPRELKVDKKDSFVMTSGGMTTGVLTLSGSVDGSSLVTFFQNKMPVDGWREMGAFRSARSIMLFEKSARWCVISIADGQFSTKVEIWVAPIKQDGIAVN